MGLEKETVHLSSKEIPKKSFVQRYSYSKTELRGNWKSVRYDQNSCEKKKEEKKNTNEERRTPVLRVRSEKRKLVVVRAWNADSVPATIRNTDAQWVIAIVGQWYVRRRRKHRIRHIASVNTVFIDGTRGHVATPS